MRFVLLLLLTSAAASAQTAAEGARDEGAFIGALSKLYAGDADVAATRLETLLESRPDDAAVLDALAEAYAALDRPDDALYHAQLATAATDRPEPRLRLAALLAERGDLAAAAAAYEAATAGAVGDPEPLIALGEIYARLGQSADERRVLLRLLDFGDTAAARLRLADLAEADGDARRAATHLEAAVGLLPDASALWARLADARARSGDADGAEAAQRRAGRLAPATSASSPDSPSDGGASVDDLLADIRAALVQSDTDPGAAARAFALAERAVGMEPRRGDVLAAAGRAAALAGRDRLAADWLVDAVGADPRQLDAWALGLTVLARTGDDRAGDLADEATLLFGSVPRVVGAAALAYASIGRADDARVAARMALPGLDTSDPLYTLIAPLSQ